MNFGKPIVPKPRTMPISSAETSAPAIEPIPPITVTMKLSIRIEKPMPGDSERTGAASAPASPASPPPTAKTIANSSVGVDAQRRNHLGVDRGGTHRLAEPGHRKAEAKHDRDQRGDADQHGVKGRHHAARDEQRRHLEGRRHPHGVEFGPQTILRVVEDQHHGVADQELHQHVGAVDATDQGSLEQHAEQRHRERSRQHRKV